MAVPTVSAAAVTVAREEELEVWNAGFFVQNVFDISDRYFVTVGARVDGNSAFGEGFGLQLYPKASASWVISDESFWSEGWGSMKLRAAYGQSGRAPGAFDAVRTWGSRGGYAGRAALFPKNLGNPELGPEVTSEFEAGFDADWFNGRLSSTFTYYNQRTEDALFEVPAIPSKGFLDSGRNVFGSSLQNVGVIGNTGIELSVDASPIQTANWGWDVGLSVATNHSEVIDLGGIGAFSLGRERDGWMIEGQPAPVMRARYVLNPDEIADPVFDDEHTYGPGVPTLTLQPSMTVRLPGAILVSARGEYQAGHVGIDWNHNSGMVNRGGWAPICWPYYVNPYSGKEHGWLLPQEVVAQTGVPEFTTELKPDTPALWRARCTPGLNRGGVYVVPADHFKLRSVSVQIPVDFAFPDRVSSSLLTITATEPWRWYNDEWLVMDPELAGQSGPYATFRGPTHRMPPTWAVSASLRVSF